MLPRFQHILVPVDFTLKNQAALDIAFDMAEQHSARVTLVHVIETIEGASDEEVRSFYNRLETRAQSEMESVSQRFVEAGIDIDYKIRYGKRTEQIVLDSIERGVDLIVMNSHKLDPQDLVYSMGTISYQVSMFCPCAILLIK